MSIADTSSGARANMEVAEQYMSQAEAKLKSWSLFGMGGNKNEAAAELYEKAANSFKLLKEWERSAVAYSKAAACASKAGQDYDAASFLVQAGNVVKKVSAKDALVYFNDAVTLYTSQGKFNMAAKQQKEVAEMLEQAALYEDAIAAYQQAADFYEGEGSKSTANQCIVKVALIAALAKQYDRAATLYTQLARSCQENNLTRFNAKEHLFRAGLCRLAILDWIGCEKAFAEFRDIDAGFDTTREWKLLNAALKAAKERNIDDLKNAAADFDDITRLDTWKLALLNVVQESIAGASSTTTGAADEGGDAYV